MRRLHFSTLRKAWSRRWPRVPCSRRVSMETRLHVTVSGGILGRHDLRGAPCSRRRHASMTPRERRGRPGLPRIKTAAGLGGFWAWTKNPIERTGQPQWVTMSLLPLAQFRLESAGRLLVPNAVVKDKNRPIVLDIERLLRRNGGEIHGFCRSGWELMKWASRMWHEHGVSEEFSKPSDDLPLLIWRGYDPGGRLSVPADGPSARLSEDCVLHQRNNGLAPQRPQIFPTLNHDHFFCRYGIPRRMILLGETHIVRAVPGAVRRIRRTWAHR